MNSWRYAVKCLLLLSGLMLIDWNGGALAQQRPNVEIFANRPDGCYLTEPPEPESLYAFTRIQLQALWLAGRGEQANVAVLTARESVPVDRMAKVLTGLREERMENICSAGILAAYSASANEGVAVTARFLALSYQALEGMSNEMLKIVLQSTQDRAGDSTLARLAQWQNRRQEILDSMITAVNYFLSLLVDQRRRDAEGNPDHMVLTRTQRDGLLNYLNAKFPALDAEMKTGHSGDFVKQAILYRSFLTGRFKPADD